MGYDVNTGSLAVVERALDQLGLALAEHDHQWSKQERRDYDWAIRVLAAERALAEERELEDAKV